MTILLAVGAALSFGVADFLGGMATKRTSVLTVTAVSTTAALVVAAALVMLMPAQAASADFWWGAGAGVAGVLGIALLYWSLARGPVKVVAPLTAIVSAVLPFAAGLALGERPGPAALAGAVLAIIAIPLVTGTRRADQQPIDRTTAVAAALSGVGFAAFFILIAQPADTAGMWPLLAAKIAALAVVAPFALVRDGRPRAVGVQTALWAGSLDMVANVFFVLAVRSGLLSMVTVVTSVYPAVTLFLAKLILGEQLTGPQRAGVATTLTGLALIAAG